MQSGFSSLDDSNGSEFDGFFADAGGVASVDDLHHVLVRLGRLLHHQFGGGHPDGDAALLQLVQHLLVANVAPRLGPRQRSALSKKN